MANTYTSLHYHFIFSTKHRQRWIRPEIEERIWEYLGGIARQNKMKPLKTGGVDDHIHTAGSFFDSSPYVCETTKPLAWEA